MAQAPRDLDWNDLKFFLAVARAGSLAGAARALRVNHSTVFRRLNSFEETLGVRLFERREDGYQPTPAGAELWERAERMATEADAGWRGLLGRDRSLSGPVRITAPESLAYRYLPGYLADLRRAHPGLQFELAVGGGMLNLTRREADIAVRATSQPPEHLVGRRVRELRWHFYGAPRYLAEHPQPPGFQDFGGHTFIGPDDSLLHLPALRWLSRALPPERMPLRANGLDAMAALAMAGLGLALLPSDQAQKGLARLHLQPPEPFTSQIWVLSHPDLRRVARIRTTMDELAGRLAGDRALGPLAAG